MPSTLVIRRRIRSIKSTRQITKAMELVAATKMRRAQIQALKSRAYALLAWDMVKNLSGRVKPQQHPLLRAPKSVKRAAILLITSNRGMAGTFNNQVIAQTLDYTREILEKNPGASVDILVSGKKGADAAVKNHLNVVADFKRVDVNLRAEDTSAISQLVTEKFSNKEYDLVCVAYTDFVSTLIQKARIKVLLPFSRLDLASVSAAEDDLGRVTGRTEKESMNKLGSLEYLFEPTPDSVFEKLLPRLIELQVYQAILESNASEHSARMVAMKNASDAAADIIDDLTLEYNQIRQAFITREIAEISAGRLALE
ncbi:MAG: ATP synthase F1 subunit gamma [Patescibacteria group bacterium]|mgnify:FL=1